MSKELPLLCRRVYSRPWLVWALYSLDSVLTVTVATVFTLSLIGLAICDGALCLEIAVSAGVPYILVTVLRRVINAKRPCEVYEPCGIELIRHKEGRSFPSRHAFSAALLGTLLLSVSAPLGILLLIFGVCIGACRVLLATHHLIDVLAGWGIGLISGIIGLLIVNIS